MKTFLFEKINSPQYYSSNRSYSLKEYLKKRETKIMSLIAFWGAESFVNLFTAFVLAASGAYVLAILSLLLMVYHTYAVFGTLGEINLI